MNAELLNQLGAAIVAPTTPTCQSSTGDPTRIDWWVIGPDLATRSPTADVWLETGLPTHRPVELRLAGPQKSLTIVALRKPVAIPPPVEPDGPEAEAARQTQTDELLSDLKRCSATLGGQGPPDTRAASPEQPAAATSAALSEWSAACEKWLWAASPETGPLPRKFAGRCAPPVRIQTVRPKPGKDGAIIPPRTATAAGIASRLLEVCRQLSGPPRRCSSSGEIRKSLRRIQRITWRHPAPEGLCSTWAAAARLHTSIPDDTSGPRADPLAAVPSSDIAYAQLTRDDDAQPDHRCTRESPAAAKQPAWAFAVALAAKAIIAPLQAHCAATAREALRLRKSSYSQWVRKALADGLGGGSQVRQARGAR